jgi:hypothetical protein
MTSRPAARPQIPQAPTGYDRSNDQQMRSAIEQRLASLERVSTVQLLERTAAQLPPGRRGLVAYLTDGSTPGPTYHDGTEWLTLLAAEKGVITAQQYGAVLDGSVADLALVKTAWQAAVAANVPFVVPLMPEPLQIAIPGDFASVQAAHDAMLDWIFPGQVPGLADASPAANHVAQVAVTITVAAAEYVSSGKGVVWNHPAGNQIEIKGEDAVGLTFASLQSTSYSSGVHFIKVRFSTWPSSDPVVGRAMRVILPTGTGHYRLIAGGWRISAVDAANKDITFVVYSREITVAMTMTLTGGTFVYIPVQFRFTNLPASGADVAGFDVFTTLRIEDCSISGSSSGTNAADTDGIICRDGAAVYLGQYMAVLEWNRCGVWSFDAGKLIIDYAGICGNGIGLNVIQGSYAGGGYVDIQGNTSYNVVVNTWSGASLTNGSFGGCGDVGIAVLAGSFAVLSGNATYNNIGLQVGANATASINSMTISDNTTIDVQRNGPASVIYATSMANVGTSTQTSGYVDATGGFTGVPSPTNPVVYGGTTTWNPASVANGAQTSTTATVTGATIGMKVDLTASITTQGLRLWGEITATDTLTIYYANTTGGAVDLASHTITYKVTSMI